MGVCLQASGDVCPSVLREEGVSVLLGLVSRGLEGGVTLNPHGEEAPVLS